MTDVVTCLFYRYVGFDARYTRHGKSSYQPVQLHININRKSILKWLCENLDMFCKVFNYARVISQKWLSHNYKFNKTCIERKISKNYL